MPAENQLIAQLPSRERTRFLSACEPIELELSQTLYEPGTKTMHVYFPTDGFISLVAVVDDASALEVGMVGREGMLGVHVGLGIDTSPLRSLVQGAGHAWRLTTAEFRTQLSGSVSLQRCVHRYVAILMSQLATSAGCARYHVIAGRLARWLLMTQDRSDTDQFHVTQEFLSYMLGVRRVGVTTAAVGLLRDGLIRYHRGNMTVVDREGLEAIACSCYEADRTAYAMLARRTAA